MNHALIREPNESRTPSRATASFVVALIAAIALLLVAAIAPLSSARAAAAPAAIFGAASPVNLVNHKDATPVEVGTRFRVVTAGQATGISFWKTTQNTGTHVGTLWSSTGKALAQVTFTGETASGWQAANFSKPVDLTAGSQYTVSYFAPKGGYAATQGYSVASRSSALSVGRDAGVFRYGSSAKMPTDTYRSSTYWVDVLFSPKTQGSAPAPTPTTPAVTPVPTPKPTTPSPDTRRRRRVPRPPRRRTRPRPRRASRRPRRRGFLREPR